MKNELHKKRIVNLSQDVADIKTECPRIDGFNVFTYAAASERIFEKNLNEVACRERKTTFYSDLAIAEWFEPEERGAIVDTCQRVLLNWINDCKYIAEFILCVNYKAWEHHERNNVGLAKLYATLYEQIADIVYDYYEANDMEDEVSYIYRYLD